ncbi:hypothetical protein [Streptosporangium sp. OZ121]|uniref:hypothetical protein n=1 Tax=Streptosporangium sp. OZ121 TaxID=3444183 RepID=UPI003F7A9A43
MLVGGGRGERAATLDRRSQATLDRRSQATLDRRSQATLDRRSQVGEFAGFIAG